MRLFEAIIRANHAAAAGDDSACLRPAEYADELPLIALTCIDPRLNPLMPEVLGLPEDQFIWLRNAGNIVTSPISSTMRSISLACAVKGGKEIAIIGHTDCLVAKTTTLGVLESLARMGVKRELLPDNINEYFGMFCNERANVLKAVGLVRASPLIGAGVVVHGLIVDINTGKLEWIVNGYETLAQNVVHLGEQLGGKIGQTVDLLRSLSEFNLGELKMPDIKIGELASKVQDLSPFQRSPEAVPATPATTPADLSASPPAPPAPPKLPLPPPGKPKLSFKRVRR